MIDAYASTHLPPAAPGRLLIVSPHPLLRDAIRTALHDVFPNSPAVEVDTVAQALASHGNGPSAPLAVVEGGPGGGVDCPRVRELTASGRAARVLLLGTAGRPTDLDASAVTALTKNCTSAELAAAARFALDNVSAIQVTTPPRTSHPRPPHELPHERLSEREYSVMLALGSGRRIRDIALDLGVSVKTVSTFRLRLMRKL
ncbi:MAG: response regulator transcription factor, partial [Burkholderiales bacterium]|nr:response regulator transcription factor [Burkholderiales bacterium]